MRHRRLLIVLAMLVPALGIRAQSGGSRLPLWGERKPGPFTVGFEVRYRIDPSRVWVTSAESKGKEQGRPIRISIWYPAKRVARATPMLFGGYFGQRAPTPYFQQLEEMIDRADVTPMRDIIFAKQDTSFNRLLTLPTAAYRNAPRASGSFPLIAYSEGYNNRSHDNSVLAEWLASHGYVVVTVPEVGPRSTRLTLRITPFDLETQARDLEFAIGEVQPGANVRGGSLGVMGYSMGGVIAMWIAGRNPNVAAVAGIDPSFRVPQYATLVMQSPWFDARRIRMPLLSLQSGNPAESSAQDTAMVHALALSDRYVAQVGNAMHADFSDFAAYATLFPLDVRDRTAVEARAAYDAVCRYVLAFFDGTLKHDSTALALVQKGDALVRMKVRQGVHAPNEEELVRIAQKTGFERALEVLRTASRRYPDIAVVDQSTMNRLGYGYLELGRTSDAVAAFRLNTDAHGSSADAWDSLAEGLAAARDRVGERAAYQKLLDVLPNDTSLSATAKDEYRRNTEAKLRALPPP